MTSLLLDAHTLLWFVWDDPQLSERAKNLIEDSGNRKLVSIATCWEIAIKVGLGKLDLGEPSRSFLPRELTRNCFELLPVSLDHATQVEGLALHHRDPFDRLLVAQSLVERMPVVSTDAVFDHYGISRLW
jgi:PIN domain nuclease of toxin-antitoxin system